MFTEAIESILIDHCTPQAVRAIEGGASAADLSDALAQSGFHALLATEADGGGGASWAEFQQVTALCGLHALPLPLPQTMAARALVGSQRALPDGLITFAPSLASAPGGSLQAQLVPFGKVASHVIAALGDALVLLPVQGAHELPSGVHASLAASFRWDASAARPLDSPIAPDRLQPLAAGLHAALLCGAMRRVFDLTMRYANERVQFGKSIGKFQAVQHQLSVMAEQVAAGSMAAQAAFDTVDGPLPTAAACAVAKARTSEAAQQVAAITHAVHGAIGITEEYDLQLYTRRLHEWRLAHGSESHWHRELGRLCFKDTQPLFADFARTLFA